MYTPRAMKAPFLAIVTAFVAALPALDVRAQGTDGDAPATAVVVDAVTREPLVQAFTVIGRLVARQRGVISANTRGSLAEMRVDIGDRVARGDVVALINPDRSIWRRDLAAAEVKAQQAMLASAEARLAVAEASVVTADARLALATQELQRFENLRSSAAYSQARHDDQRQEVVVAASQVDEARAQSHEALPRIDQAQAGILRARAALNLAADDLANTQVRVPYDGVVTLRHTSAGAFLDVGDPVISLVNDSDVEVEADVPFDRIAALTPGTEVDFRLDDGSAHRAVLRAVGVEENSKTRTRLVRFTPRFDGGTRGLADGQSASIDLPIAKQREIVSVHKDAVTRAQGRASVFVVVDGIAQPRFVELGEAFGMRFEVLDGLQPGDRVVVRGNERLMPGQAVTFDGAS